MLKKFEAEILFLDPGDVNHGVAVLTEHGFDVEILDWIDDHGPTVWINARITSELNERLFFDWVSRLVAPLRGDVVEAGVLGNPQPAA